MSRTCDEDEGEHCAFVEVPHLPDCTPPSLLCPNGLCLDQRCACDGGIDCPGGEDEYLGCVPMVSSGHGHADEFMCDNLQCMAGDLAGNAKLDCVGGSDEFASLCENSNNTHNFCDGPNDFECDGGAPLSTDLLCDGRNARGDDIDECGEQHPCSRFCVNTYGSFG